MHVSVHKQLVVRLTKTLGLYDRRHSRRVLEANWGGLPRAGEELTTCVRKFSRDSRKGLRGRRVHITGARMSASDGHEVNLRN